MLEQACLTSPGVCCSAWTPQFRGAMVCRGALGYVAFPARSGKYLPAGRTGSVGWDWVGGLVGTRVGGPGEARWGLGVLLRSRYGGTDFGVLGYTRAGAGPRYRVPGRTFSEAALPWGARGPRGPDRVPE